MSHLDTQTELDAVSPPPGAGSRSAVGGLLGLIRHRQWLPILVGLYAGIGFGLVVGPTLGVVNPTLAKTLGVWIAVPGELFLALLQLIVGPLVFASVVRGLNALVDVAQVRRLFAKLLVYLTCTCLLALTIGIVLPSLFRPGRLIAPQVIAHLPQPPTEAEVASETAEISDIPLVTELPDLLQRLVPVLQPAGGAHRGMLSLVFAAFLTGLAVIRLAPERRTLLIELCSGVQEICLTVVSWLLPWAPWAVFGLLAKTFGRVERGMLAALAVYMATVGTGLYVLIALYAGVLRWMTGRSPWHFVRGIREIQMLAFSTSSPVTVLPLTLRAAGGELGVRAAVAEAVLPICAVMNMDTVALYQATATVFLAQVYGITVNPLTLALVILGAVLASLGTPSTPGLGIIVLTGVLARMGVPAEGILLVIGVDRILDMSRSGVHVLGDLVAASVVDHWVSAEDLSLSPHPATTPPVPINPS